MQKNIGRTLKEFVQKELAPVEIVDLRTEETENADGEPLLCLWVVYKAKNNMLDPEKTVRLPRSMRQSFAELCVSCQSDLKRAQSTAYYAMFLTLKLYRELGWYQIYHGF